METEVAGGALTSSIQRRFTIKILGGPERTGRVGNGKAVVLRVTRASLIYTWNENFHAWLGVCNLVENSITARGTIGAHDQIVPRDSILYAAIAPDLIEKYLPRTEVSVTEGMLPLEPENVEKGVCEVCSLKIYKSADGWRHSSSGASAGYSTMEHHYATPE